MSSFESIQQAMLRRLCILPAEKRISLSEGDLLATLDIQYDGEDAFVAIDLLEWRSEKHQQFVSKEKVEVAYEPGFFSFREGPLLVKALHKLEGEKPKLLIVDGHGTAHPRSMGLACWLGITMNIPCMGVAKESLLKIDISLDEEAGSTMDVCNKDGVLVGKVLRTVTGVKPVFVSAGHRISQEEAVEIAFELGGPYRNIEPIRRADQAARMAAADQKPQERSQKRKKG